MSTADFFQTLPPFSDFHEVFNPARYRPAPDDWLIVVTDIRGSTAAVQAGKYKEVNVIGASAIIAVLNAVGELDIPYVFGGDGASFLIPPQVADEVVKALQGTKDMAANVFGMTLRAGMVPVADVKAAGYQTNVARYRLSDKVLIGMFGGDGLSYAEDLIKTEEGGSRYDVGVAVAPVEANFEGLECRWNPVQTSKGEILTLMARARGAEGEGVYRALFAKIREICGQQEDYRMPRQEALNLSMRPGRLKQEFGVRAYKRSWWGRKLYALKMAFETVLGVVLFKFDLKAAGVEGKKYKEDVAINTDFQKFDNTLRMVLDIRPDQAARVIGYLEDEYKKGRLFYGVQRESAAMITCLIFDRKDRHIHFIDGASGGYTCAAKAMKAQMKATTAQS